VARTPTILRKRVLLAAGGTASDPPGEMAGGDTSVQAPGVDPLGTEGVADPAEGLEPPVLVEPGRVEVVVPTVDVPIVTVKVVVETVVVGFVAVDVVMVADGVVADGVVAVVIGVVTVVEGTVTVVVGTVTVGVVAVVIGVVTVVAGRVIVGSVIVPGAAVAVPPANIVCARPKPAAERATAIAGTRIDLKTPEKCARRIASPWLRLSRLSSPTARAAKPPDRRGFLDESSGEAADGPQRGVDILGGVQ
jgi:hypothetical protein